MPDRLILSDERRARMAPHIIGDKRSPGTSGRDNRLLAEAVACLAASANSKGLAFAGY